MPPRVDPVAAYGLPSSPGLGRLTTLSGMRHAARLLAALNGAVDSRGCGDVATFIRRDSLSRDARTAVCAALAATLAHHSRTRRAELGLSIKPSLHDLSPTDLFRQGAPPKKATATIFSVRGGKVAAFRGTTSMAEALVDLGIGVGRTIPFGPALRALVPEARVPLELEAGLVSKSAWGWFAKNGGLEASLRLASYDEDEADCTLLFTGHSLGAVTATLAASAALCLGRRPVSLVTIGPPRAYDASFCRGLKKTLRGSYHVANTLDIVPALRGLRRLCTCCPSVVLRTSAWSRELVHDLVHYTYSLALYGTVTPGSLLWAPCCSSLGGETDVDDRVHIKPFGVAAVAVAEHRCRFRSF